MRRTRRYKHVIETPDPGKWELAGYETSLPITEKSNPITKDLDRVDPVQMVQLLRDCDAEIFQEEDAIVNYKRLYSESVLKTVFDIAKKVQEIIKEPEDGLIVLSGCGTSGRLALLLVNSFNKLLKGRHRRSCYTYIIAGGDRALVTSQEAPEDSPSMGIAELKKVCEGKKKVIFFGISCGLSAPFVAGQLDYCLNNLDIFVPVMVGFNPVSMASKEVIEGWHSSFFQVTERMQKLQETQHAFILNPAVGPEGICGSSRMKGGSATKILLETLFLVAHKADSDVLVSEKCLLEILRTYERAHKVTYSQSKKIATLVKQAGTSLQKKGHLYVLGWGTLGLMAIMDAVECIPTYGADYRDIRGFINSGYSELQNKEADLTSLGPEFAISHEDFVKNLLPSLSETDTVVFAFTLDDDLASVEKLALQIKEQTSNVHAISHATAGLYLPPSLKKVFPSIISVTWPILFLEYEGVFIQKFQRELSTKWILNTVSTGAHVIKGKVFRNYMVDFRVCNSKLFVRAVTMLQRLSGQSQMRSTDTLLRSIYGTEVLSDDIRNADISKHVEEASTKENVVSTAIVSLLRNCAIHEARVRLDSYPTIRAAVEASLNAIGRKRSITNIEMRSLDT